MNILHLVTSWQLIKQKFKPNNPNDSIEKIWKGDTRSEIDIEKIRLYHDEKSKKLINNRNLVDELTWSDLDMDEIFRRIDRTYSSIGSQYLYHLLHNYAVDQDQLFNNYQNIINRSSLREKLSKILLRINNTNICYVYTMLSNKTYNRPRYYFLLLLLSLMMIASIIGLFFSKEFILVVLAIGSINILVNQYISLRVSNQIPELGNLGRILGTARALLQCDEGSFFTEIQNIRENENTIIELQKRFGWLLVDTSRLDELSSSIIAYINHLFLLNLIVFFSVKKQIDKHRDSLIEVFDSIGALDASIGIAGYISSLSRYCYPELSPDSKIDVTDIYHPLLDNPVSNSFSLSNRSALITGSNMAGKTTFIKTIGVNLILSRSIGICHADKALLPEVIVKSSIRKEDNILGGKSYYYKEIELMLEFIQISEGEEKYLFLIDELFRGTNTLERLASATSVLQDLNNRSLVLVTTHDVELGSLLIEKYEMFHFQEKLSGRKHFFDYTIKPGPCTAGNAIKLLKIMGYPSNIVNNAYKLLNTVSPHPISNR